MSYRVEIPPEAQKELWALSGHVRAQALGLLHSLSENPRPPTLHNFPPLDGRPAELN